ncbi:UDP-N-acetylmuramate:L-alanyl-gamma-D-glutamyl-meso-diaminopimelate ligase [Bordetella genomosp. 13]|uniref:UDP-N-acetylmuramate:L-alanyl-gamma-D-glutamyl- meso-diaminopimelate ligase n=1 Tax=Bordetella genomosp. 13 TaxID=463040 RepID=UPI0011A2E10F|nr:UDP-N-acetylmuramate:L-alanyl-gamma-D-glutamyl-meso-diaminopimelate ligase [Bordetella genomosp. 13]
MHLHILGICGTFMGGLALIARAAGHKVTGCDAGVYPPMSTQLSEQGIELIEGFGADQLALEPDLFVIGNVVSRGNPLMEAILDSGARYVSGPQWLGDHILPGQHVLAVAGTHGKTTTSSMLAWILEANGRRPNFLIGGIAPDLQVSARFDPQVDAFVIEADEYDTAFFDKRSKFVHYRPRTAILNNLEYDHADIFPDLAAIETQFHHLVRTIPASGRIVAPTGSEALDRVLARGCWSEVASFGPAPDPAVADAWQAGPADADGAFAVLRGGQALGTVRWTLGGEHNRMNALAALAAAEHAGIAAADGIAALSRFGGVKRRMELRGTANGVKVYDDFAHHPTAIATTLDGLRRQVGQARILAVLEPRSNTMKLGTMAERLPGSLRQADLVFCFGAKEGKQALGWDPAAVLAPLGERAASFDDLNALVAAVSSAARPGDHVVVMSNGGFGGVHGKLLDALAHEPAGPSQGRIPACAARR